MQAPLGPPLTGRRPAGQHPVIEPHASEGSPLPSSPAEHLTPSLAGLGAAVSQQVVLLSEVALWPCLALPCLAWPCLAWPVQRTRLLRVSGPGRGRRPKMVS